MKYHYRFLKGRAVSHVKPYNRLFRFKERYYWNRKRR